MWHSKSCPFLIHVCCLILVTLHNCSEFQLVVVGYIFGPSTWETEAGSLSLRSAQYTEWVSGQPGTHREAMSPKTNQRRKRSLSLSLLCLVKRTGLVFETSETCWENTSKRPTLWISVFLQEEMGERGFSFSAYRAKSWPSAIQEECCHKNPAMPSSCSQTSSPQKWKNAIFCCLSHTAYGILLWQPTKLGLTTLSKEF